MNRFEAAELLTAARALVLKGWTQGFYAVTSTGEYVSPLESTACAWCASGAIMAINAGFLDEPQDSACKAFAIMQAVVGDAIPDWNDTPGRTQAEVVEAFDRAIERASA